MAQNLFIKSDPVFDKEQDDLFMSYLNSEYISNCWTSPLLKHDDLWDLNPDLLYLEPNPSPTYCSSSSSSDSEQPKKRRGRKKREDLTDRISPPMIAPAPIKPAPVTTDHQKVSLSMAKRQERLIKNRAAALLSRKRKREHLNHLEHKCNQITLQNQEYEKRLGELERENKELKKKLEFGNSDHFLAMIICYLVFIVSFSSYITGLSSTNNIPNGFVESQHPVSSISYYQQQNCKNKKNVKVWSENHTLIEKESTTIRKRFKRIFSEL